MRLAPCPPHNDFLDRLLTASGPYSENFTYNQIGNLTSKNGASYSYGTKPHAVTAAGAKSYTYDSNGNMLTGDGRTFSWDLENRPVGITLNGTTDNYTYDGDGQRVKKTVSGVTTLYVHQYFERNLSTGENTTSYYFGGKLVAQRVGTTLGFMHADHLGSPSVTTGATGTVTGTLRYNPFCSGRSGSVSTDIRFTGQRADDSTGLYFYNARYYDPELGRFVSPDTIVQDFTNPQCLNRYSYVNNNPQRFKDPSGHFLIGVLGVIGWLNQFGEKSSFVYRGLDVSFTAVKTGSPVEKLMANAGIAAVTTPVGVYYRDGQLYQPRLIGEEGEHNKQFHDLGSLGFLKQYLVDEIALGIKAQLDDDKYSNMNPFNHLDSKAANDVVLSRFGEFLNATRWIAYWQSGLETEAKTKARWLDEDIQKYLNYWEEERDRIAAEVNAALWEIQYLSEFCGYDL